MLNKRAYATVMKNPLNPPLQKGGLCVVPFNSTNNQHCPIALIVSSKRLPKTEAHVRITRQSWEDGLLKGEVRAGEFQWQFQWHFRQGDLSITPSQGRALIKEPLSRFLEQKDYQLDPGGDYAFTIRADI
jgi:hypothetical protein